MPSSTSNSDLGRRGVLGALLTLVAIVLIEIACSFLPDPTIDDLAARRVSLEETGPVDLQIMGDSVALALQADTLQTAVADRGWTVANQAHYATGPEFAYYFLKTQVAHGTAPRVIWYAPSPHTLDSTRWPLLVGAYTSPSETADAFVKTRDVPACTFGVLSRFSYSLRYRGPLGEAAKGDPANLRGLYAAAHELPPLPPEGDPDAHYPVESLPEGTYRKAFAVQPGVDRYIRALCRLAQDEGIVLIWDAMPVLPSVASDRRGRHFVEDYRAYLQSLQTEYGIVIEFTDFTVMDDAYFGDISHLNSAGVTRFQARLADRWLASETLESALAKPPAGP